MYLKYRISQNIHGFEFPCWTKKSEYRIYPYDSTRESGHDHESKRVMVKAIFSNEGEKILGLEAESIFVERFDIFAAEGHKILTKASVTTPTLCPYAILNVVNGATFSFQINQAIKACERALDCYSYNQQLSS